MGLKRFLVGMLALSTGASLGGELTDFVAAEAGAESCWQRIYDAEHLAGHPNQKVTQMTFGIGFQPPEDDIADEDGLFLFGLAAGLRDGAKGVASGGCWVHEGTARCGVDCDGGSVLIEKRADGKLLIDLEATGYIVLESECGGSGVYETFVLEPGLDDKQFLLSPADAKVCKGLVPTW